MRDYIFQQNLVVLKALSHPSNNFKDDFTVVHKLPKIIRDFCFFILMRLQTFLKKNTLSYAWIYAKGIHCCYTMPSMKVKKQIPLQFVSQYQPLETTNKTLRNR